MNREDIEEFEKGCRKYVSECIKEAMTRYRPPYKMKFNRNKEKHMGAWHHMKFNCTSKTPNEPGAVTVSFHPHPTQPEAGVFGGTSPAGNLTVKLTEEAAAHYEIGKSYDLQLAPL